MNLLTSKSIVVVTTSLFCLVLGLAKCVDKTKTTNDPRGENYIGSSRCVNCHKSIHDSYAGTAHNNSSNAASKATVKGNFENNANTYFYLPDVKVMMEQRDSALFQVAYKNNIEKTAKRFDIAIGSGRKAQTYLYWEGDNVFQLPVSWFVPAKSWANSPNYPPHQVRFDRNIPIGCFECHSSYIKLKSTEVAGTRIIDDLDKNQIVYGIDCERCHGPAADHVYFHEQHPEEKKPRYIVSYASLARQQKLDMCAVCHSGIHQNLKSTFDFKPGDTVLNNFFPPSAPVSISDVDVHANQYQLLRASQCFIMSKTLNCTSCHNMHVNERDNIAAFSKRCMNCHNNDNHNFCKMAPSLGAGIVNNCIDCHMPAKPSKLITLLSNGKVSPTPNFVRTHYISIYKEESKKYSLVK